MASSLTGISIASSYDALIKVGDNDGLSASMKVLSDGLGTESGISINNAGALTATGTVTANAFVGDITGDITGNATGLSGTPNITVADITAANETLSGNSTVTGTVQFGSLSDGTITITDFKDEDNLASDSATALATQQSIKAYVDAQVTASDLDYQGDSGGVLSVDLDSQTFSIVGTTNETVTSGSGQTLTVGLASAISGLTSIAATTFTGNLTGNVTGDVTGDLTGNSTTASNLTGTPNISVGTITAGGTITGNVTGDLTGAVTGNVTGNLTGNVTGNTSGSSGSTTGNAATATALATARTINGASFDGTGNISFDTDAVSEGSSNLYFTNERTDDRVASLVVAGTSISKTYDDAAGTLTIANTAPDQTVALTGGTGISTSGTYPNFTITNSNPDQTVALTDGTGITTSGTYPNFTITNSSPDQTVALTDGEGITTSGTYPNFTIAAEEATTSNKGVASFSSDHFSVSSGAVTIAADSIDDTLIDFGTGTNQVSTDDIPVGSTNKYWTAELTDDQVDTLLTAGSGISLTYDDAAGTLTVTSTVSGLALTDLSATDSGGDGSFSYNNGTGVFTYTGPSASEVKAHIDKTYVDSLGIAATTAATLATARTIAGVSFDGSGNISLDTDDITEATNLYYTTTRWDTQLATKDTDDLTQGSTNKYNQTHTGDVTGATALTIASDSVTYDKMQDLGTANRVLGGTATGTVGEVQISTAMISDDQVTYAKMQHTSTGNRVLGSVGAGAIGEIQVATDMVADDAVTYAKIQDTTTANRVLGAVTAGVISEVQVATDMIADDAVTAAKVASDLRAVQYIGIDAGDYIEFTADTQCDWYVNGSNEMRLEADGDLQVDGDVVAYSTVTASDERLKGNVEKIENALEKLDQLSGVTFSWRSNNKTSGGVIAQEVEKILPSLVHEHQDLNTSENFKTVDYNGVIGLLIQAVKELKENCNCVDKCCKEEE